MPQIMGEMENQILKTVFEYATFLIAVMYS